MSLKDKIQIVIMAALTLAAAASVAGAGYFMLRGGDAGAEARLLSDAAEISACTRAGGRVPHIMSDRFGRLRPTGVILREADGSVFCVR